MRLVLNVSVVLMCGALAGVTALAQPAPLRASAAPAAAVDGAELLPVRRAGSLEAHFAAANTTHDGRLTRAQAEQSDWPRVARHFDEIDAEHRGWVTIAQLHAFNRSHHRHRRDATS